MAKRNHSYMPDDCKELCNALTSVSNRYSTWQIFEDFLMMSSISISNAVDWNFKEERENTYIDIIKKYDKHELNRFVKCLSILVASLDRAFNTVGYYDLLGKVFHALELHNKYHGQFFTPFHVCEMMGRVNFGEGEILKTQDYVTCLEPCIGSGGLVLGLARAMQIKKFNPQQQLVVTGVDIDIKCVNMAYLQLSLFGIPAVIVHGNSMTCEEWSVWRTPAYILGLWEIRTVHKGTKYQTQPGLNENKEITVTESKTQLPNEAPPKFDIEYSTNRNGQLCLF